LARLEPDQPGRQLAAGRKPLAQQTIGVNIEGRSTAGTWQPHWAFDSKQFGNRKKNLQLVVNNARFLILPWIQSKGLASKILSMVNRQLPRDWHQRYGYRPELLEHSSRRNAIVGPATRTPTERLSVRPVGRGKKSRVHSQIIPLKDIWLYPLRNNFRAVLCQ